MADSLDELLADMPQMNANAKHWWERYYAYLQWLDQRAERLRKSEGRSVGSLAEFQRNTSGMASKAFDETEPELRKMVNVYLDRLCAAYYKSEPEVCTRARTALVQNENLRAWLPFYVNQHTQKIQAAEDANRVRVALAALALEDATYYPNLSPRWEEDNRNIRKSFNPLQQAASRAGIDLLPLLRHIAARSSDQPSWVAEHSPSLRTWFGQVIDDLEQARARDSQPIECPEIGPTGNPAICLSAGQSVEGNIGRDAAPQLYQFKALRGQVITVTVQPLDKRLIPFVALLDDTGNVLKYAQGPGVSVIQQFVIPMHGCYYANVTCRKDGVDRTQGRYQLVVTGFS